MICAFNLDTQIVSKKYKKPNTLLIAKIGKMKKMIISALVVSGGFMFAQQTSVPSMKDKPSREVQMKKIKAAHFEQMQKSLDLSAAQLEQIKALHEKQNAERMAERSKMQELRKERIKEYKAKQEKKNEEMKAILSKEQYAKWEAMRAERMAQNKARLQNKTTKKTMEGKGGFHKKTVFEPKEIAK